MTRYFGPRRMVEPRAPRDPQIYSEFQPQGPTYDRSRNPTPRAFTIFRQPAAAALTITPAWTYTVPMRRAANIEAMRCLARNNSTTALNGLVVANITMTPPNGQSPTLLQAILLTGETVVVRNEVAQNAGIILAGTIVEAGLIVQNSAAGTNVGVEAAALFTEFDN